jgi:AraC family transcriptional regulator
MLDTGDPIHSKLPAPSKNAGEAAAWREINGTWHPLHGRFLEEGLSVEWHDFRLDTDMDWARSFHPGCLEICLNFSGSGWLQDGSAKRRIEGDQIALYTTQMGRPQARREAGSWHRFLTLECGSEFLGRHFAECLPRVKEPVRRFVEGKGEPPPWLEIAPLTTVLLGLRSDMLEPRVPAGARSTWYRAKALEILAHTVFEPDDAELFCHRQKRLNHERAERVCYLLERDLGNPPTLEMLAQEVGCSSFHLSRIFAEETGGSIPKYLRTKRIERAAYLLRSGKVNVTEAALRVGYSSLGAFNKAFVEQMGCCPGLYPMVKIPGRNAAPVRKQG